MNGFFTYEPIVDKQDYGHTGALHSPHDGEYHLGMFVFETGEYDICHFECVLPIDYFVSEFPDDFICGTITMGTFSNPEYLYAEPFLDELSLMVCGWQALDEPIPVYRSQLIKTSLTVACHSALAYQFYGFLFTPVYSATNSFVLHFNSPELHTWPKFYLVDVDDSSVALDDYRPKDSYFEESVSSKEHFNADVFYTRFDFGTLKPQLKPIQFYPKDTSVNYSKVITHIVLSETGEVKEIYGFNGLTNRDYFERFRYMERAYVIKYNYVTWSGLLVDIPWASLLWYGKIYFFADLEEFGECCRTHFKEHGQDVCPVCGQPIGGHFKYSFIDVMRVPHQIYFCSKDCLHGFYKKLNLYLSKLTKSNAGYLLERS